MSGGFYNTFKRSSAAPARYPTPACAGSSPDWKCPTAGGPLRCALLSWSPSHFPLYPGRHPARIIPDLLARHFALADPCRGIPRVDTIGCRFAAQNAAHGDDRVAGQVRAGAHDGEGAHPASLIEGDGHTHEAEAGIFVVVVAGEQIRSLRDANVVADGHADEVVDPRAFADPGVLADAQMPGVLDVYPRLDNHPRADARAEQAKQCSLGSRDRQQPSRKQRGIADVPEQAHDKATPWGVAPVVVVRQIDCHRDSPTIDLPAHHCQPTSSSRWPATPPEPACAEIARSTAHASAWPYQRPFRAGAPIRESCLPDWHARRRRKIGHSQPLRFGWPSPSYDPRRREQAGRRRAPSRTYSARSALRALASAIRGAHRARSNSGLGDRAVGTAGS